MPQSALPTLEEWGYGISSISPDELASDFTHQVLKAIVSFAALPEGPEPCRDKAGYCRASVAIPLPPDLFDQLMNGQTGYRAHYAADIDVGERFNRELVNGIASLIVESEQLYADRFGRAFCSNSLLGPFTKLWYSKQLTDPAAKDYLLTLPEAIYLPRWQQYWQHCSRPHKGLLAPLPDDTAVLVNGSFVNELGDVYEQKPERSKQLFDTGWT